MVSILLTAAILSGSHVGHATSDAWTTPAARCEALAGRFTVAPSLRPAVAEMCRRAPTFRRQVVRLASAPQLDVSISPGVFTANGRSRARTAMQHVGGELRRAVVEVPRGDTVLLAELLAHEFEHILEQLDGVQLVSWAGRSGVYRVGSAPGDGPFETERAKQIGRRVAGEFMAADATVVARRVW